MGRRKFLFVRSPYHSRGDSPESLSTPDPPRRDKSRGSWGVSRKDLISGCVPFLGY